MKLQNRKNGKIQYLTKKQYDSLEKQDKRAYIILDKEDISVSEMISAEIINLMDNNKAVPFKGMNVSESKALIDQWIEDGNGDMLKEAMNDKRKSIQNYIND